MVSNNHLQSDHTYTGHCGNDQDLLRITAHAIKVLPARLHMLILYLVVGWKGQQE